MRRKLTVNKYTVLLNNRQTRQPAFSGTFHLSNFTIVACLKNKSTSLPKKDYLQQQLESFTFSKVSCSTEKTLIQGKNPTSGEKE